MRSCTELFTNRGFYFKIIELVFVVACRINGMLGKRNNTDSSHLSNVKTYQEHEYFAITSPSGAACMLVVFIVAYAIDETNHYIVEVLFLFLYAFLMGVAGVFLIVEAECLRTVIGGSMSILVTVIMLIDLFLLRSENKNNGPLSD